eukprot:GHVU01218811.1.p1 GENE.GHVU01218811.1~~GHVU01218811.1.p1  ORF type:complete len:183 (-),score=23.32 GHVU01218811.1:187-735(-)
MPRVQNEREMLLHCGNFSRQIRTNPHWQWKYSCLGEDSWPSLFTEFDYAPEEVRWGFYQTPRSHWGLVADYLRGKYEQHSLVLESIAGSPNVQLPDPLDPATVQQLRHRLANYQPPQPLSELIVEALSNGGPPPSSSLAGAAAAPTGTFAAAPPTGRAAAAPVRGAGRSRVRIDCRASDMYV